MQSRSLRTFMALMMLLAALLAPGAPSSVAAADAATAGGGPRMIASGPAPGATMEPDRGIVLTFAAPVQPGPALGAVALIDEAGRTVRATVSVHDQRLVVLPEAPLQSPAKYSLVVPAAAVTDADGRPLSGDIAIPVATAGTASQFVNAAAGDDTLLLLRDDGTLWAVQPPAGGTGDFGDGSVDLKPVPELKNVLKVAGRGTVLLAATLDGKVWEIRRTQAGGLQVTPSAQFGEVQTLVISGETRLAMLNDGSVWSWSGPGAQPVQVKFPGKVSDLAVAGDHAYAVESGNLWTWSLNPKIEADRWTLTKVDGFMWELPSFDTPSFVVRPPSWLSGGVLKVAAGTAQTLALTYDGRVWSWRPDRAPDRVASLMGVKTAQIAAGVSNWAVTSDRKLWRWAPAGGAPKETGLTNMWMAVGGNRYDVLLGWEGSVWTAGDVKSTAGPVRLRSLAESGPATAEPPALKAVPVVGQSTLAGGDQFTLMVMPDGRLFRSGIAALGMREAAVKVEPPAFTHAVPLPLDGLSDVVSVAAGAMHALALHRDGTVSAWGHNGLGELGDGTKVSVTGPVTVKGLADVRSVTAGWAVSFAVRNDGTVWGWGKVRFTEGADEMQLTPVRAPGIADAVAVTMAPAGGPLAVLRRDGTVWVCSSDWYPNWGSGSRPGDGQPVKVAGLTGVAAIAGQQDGLVALKRDGTVWLWNRWSDQPVRVEGLRGVIQVAAGAGHWLALRPDGTVWSGGDNSDGQLGREGTGKTLPGAQIPGLAKVVSIGAGSRHSLALTATGQLMAWGGNQWGQLGDGSWTQRPRPTAAVLPDIRVNRPPAVRAVRPADGQSGTYTDDVLVVEFGEGVTAGGFFDQISLREQDSGAAIPAAVEIVDNQLRVIPDAPLAPRTRYHLSVPAGAVAGCRGVENAADIKAVFTTGAGARRFKAVAAGEAHALAVRDDGTVWAWGLNENGELGNGANGYQTEPVQVEGLTGVTAVAASAYHSLAIEADGSVWAWGLVYGQRFATTTPFMVPGLKNVTQVAAGYMYSLALEKDGTVWAWGNEHSGTFGDGTDDRQADEPVQVKGLPRIRAIAAGDYHALALAYDGTVWAWGDNGSGQLGDSTRLTRRRPVQVPGITGALQIGAGGRGSLAVLGNGTTLAWGTAGFDLAGGDGIVPQPITGLDSAVAVAVGDSTGLALLADGTLQVWGYGLLREGGNPGRMEALMEDVQAISIREEKLLLLRTDGSVWLMGRNDFDAGPADAVPRRVHLAGG